MRDRLISEDPASEKIIKPILRGRDIARYRVNWANLWLISTFPSLGLDIDEYPAVKRHLLEFGKQRLAQNGRKLPGGERSRKKTPHDWFELQDTCAYHAKFAEEKLLWIELADRGRFAYDDTGVYGEATTFVLNGEHLKFLCAILNSNASQWYLSHTAPTSGMGTLRWKKVYVETIPIPRLSVENQCPFVGLVDRIIAAKHCDPDADITADEEQLDHLVNALYGFTEQEIISLSSEMPGSRTWNNL